MILKPLASTQKTEENKWIGMVFLPLVGALASGEVGLKAYVNGNGVANEACLLSKSPMAEIVIMEQDFDLADNISEILKYGNFKVSTIKSLKDKGAKGARPAVLIIGDQSSGDSDCAEHIKDLCSRFHCPVVILSSDPQTGCTEGGCPVSHMAEVVYKPFTFKSLHTAINRALLNAPVYQASEA